MIQDEQKRVSKAAKKTSPALALYAHPPAPRVMIFGKAFVFSGPVFLYVAMSFIAGFLDSLFFLNFGAYATMSTGNIIQACIYFYEAKVGLAIFAVAMTLSTTVVGGAFSCFVLEWFPNKVQSFTVLSLSECVACIITALIRINIQKRSGDFAALLVGITNGALCQWVLKMGYTFPLYTINILKLSESVYKLFRNVSQGGAKLRGDVMTVLLMLVFFIGGCFGGAQAHRVWGHRALFVVSIVHIVQILYLYVLDYFPSLCISCRLPSSRAPRAASSSNPPTIGAPTTAAAAVPSVTNPLVKSPSFGVARDRTATIATNGRDRAATTQEQSNNSRSRAVTAAERDIESGLSLSQHQRISTMSADMMPSEIDMLQRERVLTMSAATTTLSGDLMPSEVDMLQREFVEPSTGPEIRSRGVTEVELRSLPRQSSGADSTAVTTGQSFSPEDDMDAVEN